MTPADRATRGDRARAALREFVDEAFTVAMADYQARLIEIAAEKPWETEKIAKLATAFKIARTVKAQIEALVADGDMAQKDMSRAAQIERIRADKRTILGY
jgi:hypothetical protein